MRLVGPPLGAVLVALAARSHDLYRLIVQEDALLEWAQVIAYVAAVWIAVAAIPRVWHSGEAIATFALVGLALVSLLSIGEELSWGQRLIGFETPELAARNRQGELTLHNDARLEDASRIVVLLVATYGVLAPFLIGRRTPLVPPRTLVSFFAVVTVYYAVRLLVFDTPSYVQAKFSEWPETCLAAAVALWCADVASARGGSRGC